jgi:tetratricopeptide (TPR) repeat protein
MPALLVYAFAGLLLAPQFPPASPRQPPKPPSAPPAPPSTRERSATGDALDRYARGEYSGAVALLSVLGGFNVDLADVWNQGAGPDAAPRRRLAAASLILDIAAAKEAWPSGLIEWACDAFRLAGAPTPGEALWLRASIALAQQDEVWVFLMPELFDRTPPTPTIKRAVAKPQALSGHLARARTRFPDDPYFGLAEAVGVEVASTRSFDPRVVRSEQTPVAFDRLSAAINPPEGLSDDQRALLERARLAFEQLRSQKAVQAEASLRLGFTLLRLGRTAEGRDRLREVDTATDDAWVRYLARMFRGWIHASEGRPDEAVTAYQSALALVPNAPSAAALLTATLLTSDRLADAETFATATLAAGSGEDPWRGYTQGEARRFPALMAQLRREVR